MDNYQQEDSGAAALLMLSINNKDYCSEALGFMPRLQLRSSLLLELSSFHALINLTCCLLKQL